MPETTGIPLDIGTLLARYRQGGLSPRDVMEDVSARVEGSDGRIWISRVDRAELLRRADALEGADRSLPLYGIPFAVKDNIDVADMETTAACPDFAYRATETAPVVQRLIDAGAILVGKTNLDQFATGLVGTRSPYGVAPNPFDPAYIPGGSSSGSAVAVASGIVSFALGTDTAGSGRVPAAFNNIVGLKPTRGMLSTRGVVPACRTLDCVSIFALTAPDTERVFDVAEGFDPHDPFSRVEEGAPRLSAEWSTPVRIGVPTADQLSSVCEKDPLDLFRSALECAVSLGLEITEVDLTPFLDAARLLYEGPWVAERYLAVRGVLESNPDALLPVTRQIIESGTKASAADAFQASYRLAELRRESETVWRDVDALLIPTAPTIYRVDEIEADPIALNSKLGTYTNFMNLLDLCGIAIPAGFLPSGLPFGVTVVGQAFTERSLCATGSLLHAAMLTPLGATGHVYPTDEGASDLEPRSAYMQIAVCGAHMEGLPLNGQLTELGARFRERTHTAAHYRMVALLDPPPIRPGLVRTRSGGASFEVEIWDLPKSKVGEFLENISQPLAIGSVSLEDGRIVKGFLCEAHAADAAQDISRFGGWRAFLRAKDATQNLTSS